MWIDRTLSTAVRAVRRTAAAAPRRPRSAHTVRRRALLGFLSGGLVGTAAAGAAMAQNSGTGSNDTPTAVLDVDWDTRSVSAVHPRGYSSIALAQRNLETADLSLRGGPRRPLRELLNDVAVSVRDFGALGDGRADDTEAIQRAIDAVAREQSGAVFLPPGRYRIRSLVMRHGVAIQGVGAKASMLEALPSDAPALISLDEGPVQFADLRALRLVGGQAGQATNPGQWAVHYQARPIDEPPFHGGAWFTSFDTVYVTDFDNGLWFEGGASDYLLPHQFNRLNNVIVTINATPAGRALLCHGQCNQFDYTACVFDRRRWTEGINIELGSGVADANTPKLHHLNLVTAQRATTALAIRGAHNVTIENCWFENLHQAIDASGEAEGLLITRCRFANAAGDGFCARFGPRAHGAFTDNLVAGAVHRMLVNDSQIGVEAHGNRLYWNDPSMDDLAEAAAARIVVAADGTLDLANHRHAVVETGGRAIRRIRSQLLPGEQASIVAVDGPLAMAAGGDAAVAIRAAATEFPAQEPVLVGRSGGARGHWVVAPQR